MANKNKPFEVCFVGSHKGVIPEGTLLVLTDRDYVEACKAINDAANRPKGVWVAKRPHFTWFQTYCDLLDLDCCVRELTPRVILADRWGVTIPDWLDDQRVESEKLLDLDVSTEGIDDFVDVVLGHFLSRSFCSPRLDSEQVSEILSAVVAPEYKAHSDRYPIISDCLSEKCVQWEKNADQPWMGEFGRSLADQPDALWHDLTLWALLGHYPGQLIEFVTGPQRVVFLKSIHVGLLSSLPLHLSAIDAAQDQIRLFFNDIRGTVSSTEDLKKVLGAVSRRLAIEFSFVEQILEISSYELQAKDIELVGETFKTCPGVGSVKIDALDRFVPPTRPSESDAGKAWEGDRWLDWSIKEYIPYRQWQIQNKHYDRKLEQTVQAFSDWYVDEYMTIHQDTGRSLVHLLSEWREHLVNDDLSLILLIDCLPVAFWPLFEEAMRNIGFHRHQQEFRFAPLPSHTEVCKPLLLGSDWENTDTKYASLLQKRGLRDWPSKQVLYLHNLQKLSEADLGDGASVLVLNFLTVDRILHSDVEADGSTHREELSRLFVRLAGTVKDLLSRWQGDEDKFGVYVVTDHGATKIIDDEKATLDSQIVNRLFENEKHRFAQIPEDYADEIPENLWAFGYRFKPPFNNQDTVFFIPKGHNTVKTGNKTTGFVHGGAAPEEVIVPAAIFRPVKASWRQAEVRFVDLRMDHQSGHAIFYILRVVPIKLEVQNPNAEPIRIVRANVVSPDADIKEFTTGQIDPESVGELSLSCYFQRSAQDQEELLLRITYELAGDEYTRQVRTAAVFRSATTGGFNLRDLIYRLRKTDESI
jgi:hypothetical protein